MDTPEPEAYTRLGNSGSTSSPWLPRKGQREPQHRRHHGEKASAKASAKPSRSDHFPDLTLAREWGVTSTCFRTMSLIGD